MRVPADAQSMPNWLSALETDAPDVVGCWRVAERLRPLRRELRSRVAIGAAPSIVEQQEAVAAALADVLVSLPAAALRAPGGEDDWNVAQTFAHATAARRFLATWAAQDVDGPFTDGRSPSVRPSVPGRPDAGREELMVLLDKSRHAQREAAARIAGHETERCGLDHPLVGRLHHGEWLLFVGVHDLMHLEQLHRLAASFHE
jgi:hypothetical protein